MDDLTYLDSTEYREYEELRLLDEAEQDYAYYGESQD